MSNWRILLREIDAAGGEAVSASGIPGWGVTLRTRVARQVLLRHDLIKPVGQRLHSITKRGRRVIEGSADLVEHRQSGISGHVPRTYSLVVRGAIVPDGVIYDLMLESGIEMGALITRKAIKEYSDRLAAVVRVSR